MATVIASTAGLSLFLLPASAKAVDPQALDGVLRRHGLALLPGATAGLEFIAAEGRAQRVVRELG
jgi:hypothetical protein